jgi:hypothetical protein
VNLIPEYQQLFAAVARVLEPNGVFVFNVPNLTSCYWPIGAIINYRQRTATTNATGARYSHWFSRREWRRSLERSGFCVETVVGEPPWCGIFERCSPLGGARTWICKSLFIKARRT